MILLINPFTVLDGREAEFLSLWDRTASIFRASPGYVSARLVRALQDQAPGQSPPFTHFNVAEWMSRDAYVAALQDRELRQLAPMYRACSTFQPALYEIVRSV